MWGFIYLGCFFRIFSECNKMHKLLHKNPVARKVLIKWVSFFAHIEWMQMSKAKTPNPIIIRLGVFALEDSNL